MLLKAAPQAAVSGHEYTEIPQAVQWRIWRSGQGSRLSAPPGGYGGLARDHALVRPQANIALFVLFIYFIFIYFIYSY